MTVADDVDIEQAAADMLNAIMCRGNGFLDELAKLTVIRERYKAALVRIADYCTSEDGMAQIAKEALK